MSFNTGSPFDLSPEATRLASLGHDISREETTPPAGHLQWPIQANRPSFRPILGRGSHVRALDFDETTPTSPLAPTPHFGPDIWGFNPSTMSTPLQPPPRGSRSGPLKPGRECKFCKNNGESPESYRSHVLRNPSTGQLICPVLREHRCEVCGATGDDAHTRSYCPKLKMEQKKSLPVMLKGDQTPVGRNNPDKQTLTVFFLL